MTHIRSNSLKYIHPHGNTYANRKVKQTVKYGTRSLRYNGPLIRTCV